MSHPLFYDGQHYKIAFYARPDQTVPARDFLEGYEKGNREWRPRLRLEALIQRYADSPPGTRFPGDQFKRVEGDIWEFKAHQLRVFVYLASHRRVFLLMGIQKQQDGLRQGELQQIRNMANEFRASANL